MVNLLLGIFKQRGYKVNEKPYQLNIVGLRSSATTAGNFDDHLVVFFKNNAGKWVEGAYKITTDPGTYWLKHPMNVDGTAILKEGQYVDAYKIGLHKGQYTALVQAKPVTILRDYDRNATLDFSSMSESTGMFGINIHRAGTTGTTSTVDKWSAGCQVFEQAKDFEQFIKLCEMHRKYYGNSFTYTLIDFRQARRKLWKQRATIGLAALLAAGALTYYLLKN